MTQAAAQRGLPMRTPRRRQQVADLYGRPDHAALLVIDAEGILRYQGALNDITFRQRNATHFYLRDAVNALLSGTLPYPVQTTPYGCAIVRHMDSPPN